MCYYLFIFYVLLSQIIKPFLVHSEGSVLARFRITLRPKSPEGFKAEMRIRQKLEEHFAKKIGEHGPWQSVKFNPSFIRRFLKIEPPKVKTTPVSISTTQTVKTSMETEAQDKDILSTTRKIINETTARAHSTTEAMVTKDRGDKMIKTVNRTSLTTKEITASTDKMDKLETTKIVTDAEMTTKMVTTETVFPPKVVTTSSDVTIGMGMTKPLSTQLPPLDTAETITSVTEFSLNVTDTPIDSNATLDSTSIQGIFMNETTMDPFEIFENVTFPDNGTFATEIIQEMTTVTADVALGNGTTAMSTDTKKEIVSKQSTDQTTLTSKISTVKVTEETSIPISSTQSIAQDTDKVTQQILELITERVTTASVVTSKDGHVSTIEVSDKIPAVTTETYTTVSEKTTTPSMTNVTDFVDIITGSKIVQTIGGTTSLVTETPGNPEPLLTQNLTLDFNDTKEPTTVPTLTDQETSSFVNLTVTAETMMTQGINTTDFLLDFMNESTTIDQLMNETTSLIETVTDILPGEQLTSSLPTDSNVTAMDILNVTDGQMSSVTDLSQTMLGRVTTTFEADTLTPNVTVLVDTAAAIGETPQIFKIPETTQAQETTTEPLAVTPTGQISINESIIPITPPTEETVRIMSTEPSNAIPETATTVNVFTLPSETSQEVINQTADYALTQIVTKEASTRPAGTVDPMATYSTPDIRTSDFSSADTTVATSSVIEYMSTQTSITDGRQSTVLDATTSLPAMNITGGDITHISIDNVTKDGIALITAGVTLENISETNMTMGGLNTKELTTVPPTMENATVGEPIIDGLITDGFTEGNMTIAGFTTGSLSVDNVTIDSVTSISDQITDVNASTGIVTTGAAAIDGTSTVSAMTDVAFIENLTNETYSTDNVTLEVTTVADIALDQISTFNAIAGETVTDGPTTDFINKTKVTTRMLMTEKMTEDTFTPYRVTTDTLTSKLTTPDSLITDGFTDARIVTNDSFSRDTLSEANVTTQRPTSEFSQTAMAETSTVGSETSSVTGAILTGNRSKTTVLTAISDIQTQQPIDNVTVDTMTAFSSNESFVTDFINDTYLYETDTTTTFSADVNVTNTEAVTTSYNATTAVSSDTQIVSDLPMVTDIGIGNVTAFETYTTDSPSNVVTHDTSIMKDTSKLTSEVMGTATPHDGTVFTTPYFTENNTLPSISIKSTEQPPLNVSESILNVTDSTVNVSESTVSIIDSTEYAIDSMENVTDSTMNVTDIILNVTDSTVNVTESTVSIIDSTVNTIDSMVNVTDSTMNVTDIILNVTDSNVNVTESTVSIIDSTVNTIDSMVNVTDSIMNVTDIILNVTDSNVNVTESTVSIIDSPVNTIDSMVNVTDSAMNVTDSIVNATDSTVIVTHSATNVSDSIDVPSNVTDFYLDVTNATEIPLLLNFTDFPLISTPATDAVIDRTVNATSSDVTDVGLLGNVTSSIDNVTSAFVEITTMSPDNITDTGLDIANVTDFMDSFTQSNVTESSIKITSSTIDSARNLTSLTVEVDKSTYSTITSNVTDSSTPLNITLDVGSFTNRLINTTEGEFKATKSKISMNFTETLETFTDVPVNTTEFATLLNITQLSNITEDVLSGTDVLINTTDTMLNVTEPFFSNVTENLYNVTYSSFNTTEAITFSNMSMTTMIATAMEAVQTITSPITMISNTTSQAEIGTDFMSETPQNTTSAVSLNETVTELMNTTEFISYENGTGFYDLSLENATDVYYLNETTTAPEMTTSSNNTMIPMMDAGAASEQQNVTDTISSTNNGTGSVDNLSTTTVSNVP